MPVITPRFVSIIHTRSVFLPLQVISPGCKSQCTFCIVLHKSNFKIIPFLFPFILSSRHPHTAGKQPPYIKKPSGLSFCLGGLWSLCFRLLISQLHPWGALWTQDAFPRFWKQKEMSAFSCWMNRKKTFILLLLFYFSYLNSRSTNQPDCLTSPLEPFPEPFFSTERNCERLSLE